MAIKDRRIPAVIYAKVGAQHATILEITNTLEAQDRINELCGSDAKKRKHYHFVAIESDDDEMQKLVGTKVPISKLTAHL